ncbi:MAG: heme o synthase [bacterium]|nr:heme o synthase [bacterium]
MRRVSALIQLTKPSIMLLVLFTGATSLIIEGSFLGQPVDFFLVMLGLFLTGGSANALNQYFEREIDSRMSRTSSRRPLPTQKVKPTEALVFSITIGVVGVLLFWYFFNLLTAMLSLGTILFYSLFYTLWLKPNTPQNIVIGGIAGAMAPVGAWTAATGQFDFVPWVMFLIIFLWTPPHFWALALYSRTDYEKVKLPMMPVVVGEDRTYKQIVIYSFVLFLTSLSLLLLGAGWFYAASAIFLGYKFIRKVFRARAIRSESSLKGLFGYSLVYLFALFMAIIVDSLLLPGRFLG